jgi:DDB1- and CUL4-associated factor 11
VVQVLDRAKTLPLSFDPSGPEPELTTGLRTNTCVRDVSWHSQVRIYVVVVLFSFFYVIFIYQEPVLMSAGWENGRGGSVVARHEWKGLSKMPGALEDWVEKNTNEQRETESRARKSPVRRSVRLRNRALHIPGAFQSEAED